MEKSIQNQALKPVQKKSGKMFITFLFLIMFILSSVSAVFAQQRAISGTVTDNTGNPIPGATVVVKDNTTIGIVTDIDGNYTLNVPADAEELIFSFVGFVTQEIPISGAEINVVLEEDVIGLDEVVAIGYGTTTRRNFTGAVTQVSVDDSPLSDVRTTSALDLLQGISPGVQLSQSGRAGSTSDILIRGQRSISGDNEPLIVLDGVIFNGNIESIDPGIIEELSVLKDASSLAAYGSRAANGVIMITTKQGKIGAPVISVRTSATHITPNYKPDARDAYEYIELMNARGGLPLDADPTPWMTPIELANYQAGEITDWYDLLVRPGITQNYSADISGGTETVRYLVGALHNNQESFILGDNFKRTTFNAKVDTKLSQYISIGANFNQGFSESHGSTPNFSGAVDFSPWAEPYLSDGVSIRKYPDQKETTSTNPLWGYDQGFDNSNVSKSTILGGSLDVTVPWVEGLSYKMTGTYTVNTSIRKRFEHETNWVNIVLGEAAYTANEYKNFLPDANGSISNSESQYWIIDNILTYVRQFGGHSINATGVYTRSSRISDSSSLNGSDFAALGNTILGVYGLNNASNQTVNSGWSEKTDVAFLGRVIYVYNNTYQINASVRRDGSSVFGSENKWGIFPAVGVAWTVSNEGFMNSVSGIDFLKLKFSYGKNGNQALSPYGTLSTIQMGRSGGRGVIFDENSVYWGQRLSTLGNPQLAWETTKSFNAGFEADIMNKRIHVEVDGYKSQTTDQIFNRTIPVMGAGITSQRATMGQVDNWGLEATVRTLTAQTADLTWNTSLVFSMNRNKLIEIDGSGEDFVSSNLFLGESLGAIYGYENIGIVQADDVAYKEANGAVDGDVLFANLDGSEDGRITSDDRKIRGFSRDGFRLSMTNTLSYKKFRLYFMLNGVFTAGDYGYRSNTSAYTSYHGFAVRNELDHPFWTVEKPSEVYPNIDFYDNRFQPLQKLTYIRLQDVNLSYDISSMVDQLGISSLSVYIAGRNLAFWAAEWEFSDPEVGSWSQPQLQRQITLGINLSF